MQRFEEIEPPTAEPITLQQVRIHLRQGADGESPSSDSPNLYEDLPDDSWMLDKITAARQSCEAFLGYPLTDALYRLVFTDFSGRMVEPGRWDCNWRAQDFVLPYGVGDVESIQYLDAMNVLQTVPPSTVYYDPVTRQIYNDASWPQLSSRSMPVRINVRSIFGTGESPPVRIPATVKHAMLLMIGEWNENRILSIEGKFGELPLGIEWLLRPHRFRLGMA